MDDYRKKIRENLKNKPPGASLSIEEIRELKEIENERVNNLIREGGEALHREYLESLSFWDKVFEKGHCLPEGRSRNRKSFEPSQELLEPVSRSKFHFRLARFWSSPDLIPGVTIIAHVLKNPAKEDVLQVIDFFGVDSVNEVMQILQGRQEISDRAMKRSEEYIEMHRGLNKSGD